MERIPLIRVKTAERYSTGGCKYEYEVLWSGGRYNKR